MSRPNSPITGQELLEQLCLLTEEARKKLPVYAFDPDIEEIRAVLQVDLTISDRIDLNLSEIGEV